MAILFALLSAFSNATTAVLQRLASVSQPETTGGWRTALALVRDPRWLLGLVFMGGTFVFQAVALYFGELAVVQPILVTELIFTLALRRWWLHDPIPPKTWTAAVMICGGLAAFLLAAHPEEGHRVATVGDWVWALTTRGLVVVVLVLLSRTGSPAAPRRAAGSRGGAGLGHRRRLRQGRHRPAVAVGLDRPARSLAALRRGGQRGARAQFWSRRPSPPGRWPPHSRPCSSSTRWLRSPWGSSSSASSCARACRP